MSWGHHEERDERHDDAGELLQVVEVRGRAPGPKGGIPGSPSGGDVASAIDEACDERALRFLARKHAKRWFATSCAAPRPPGPELSLHHWGMNAHVPS